MKRLLYIGVILAALVVLLATGGVGLHTHHCNSEGRMFVSLMEKAESCHTAILHSCCSPGENEPVPEADTRLSEQPCCTNSHVFLVIENDFEGSRKQEKSGRENTLHTGISVNPDREQDILTRRTLRTYTLLFPPGPSGRQLVLLLHQPKIPSPFDA